MSLLRDLLNQKGVAPGAQPPPAAPPPAYTPPAGDPFAALLGRAGATTPPAMPAAAPMPAPQPARPMTPPVTASPAATIGDMVFNTDSVEWTPQVAPPFVPAEGDTLAGQLRVMLDALSNVLSTADVTDALHRVMTFVQANPATADLLMPVDIQLLTRAAQSGHGVVIAAKAERKDTKRGRSDKVVAAANDLLAIGFGLNLGAGPATPAAPATPPVASVNLLAGLKLG